MQCPDFRCGRVLIAGDVMLDRYWRGPCVRVSPEAPVPIVRVEHNEDRPGGAANVAANTAALGARTRLLGVVGDDDAGRRLAAVLTARQVGHRLLTIATATTITKLRVVSQNQQLLRLDFETGFAGLDAGQVRAALRESLDSDGIQVLVLSDYAKGTLGEPQPLIEAARARRLPVLIDPKGADFDRYRGATLLTPNLGEFRQALAALGLADSPAGGQAQGGPDTAEDAWLERHGERLRRRLELEALLITRSERGVSLLRRDAPALHLPARAREVYDVTGAGDTVVATLAAALAAGATLADATALANLAGGLAVAKLGTASVTAGELARAAAPEPASALDASPETAPDGATGGAVVDEPALLRAVAAARARGETLVMTNGCFDLLHAGHVGYLAEARRLGDRLIVAVNDDASVARLKGPRRPVTPLAQRMQVLAALASVDWVVPFAEDTPARLIGAVLPDVLVKGGDYRPGDIAGGDRVRAAGGEVRVLGYRAGQSTSALIGRMEGGGDRVHAAGPAAGPATGRA